MIEANGTNGTNGTIQTNGAKALNKWTSTKRLVSIRGLITLIALMVLMPVLLTACSCVQSNHQTNNYDGDDDMMNNSVNNNSVNNNATPQTTPRPTPRPTPIPQTTPDTHDVWLEQWLAERAEINLTNLFYLTHDYFTPAPDDTDLRTIERFISIGGRHTLVIDRAHGRAYYDPWNWVPLLDMIQYSAAFIEEDLDRLIQMIEESEMQTWKENYAGGIDPDIIGGAYIWRVGIEFSDGTILRRGGGGHYNNIPPQHQWRVLVAFLDALGEEIMERHAAEVVQNEGNQDEAIQDETTTND